MCYIVHVYVIYLLFIWVRLHCRSGTEHHWNTGMDTEEIPPKKWTHVAITHKPNMFKVCVHILLRSYQQRICVNYQFYKIHFFIFFFYFIYYFIFFITCANFVFCQICKVYYNGRVIAKRGLPAPLQNNR